MPHKTQAPPNFVSPNLWTPREAYLLAMVCLLTGLLLGYVFHGSAPVPAATVTAAPGTTQPAGMPGRLPTAADLQPLAAPLLAALKADPKSYENLAQLGNIYYDHQVFPEAIEYYTRALELRPKDVNVRTDLGTAYWYSGFPEKAVGEYQKSLAVDPVHTNTLFNLGVVKLEGMKDPAGALAALEKLLAVNPSAPQRDRALELIAKAKGMRP